MRKRCIFFDTFKTDLNENAHIRKAISLLSSVYMSESESSSRLNWELGLCYAALVIAACVELVGWVNQQFFM